MNRRVATVFGKEVIDNLRDRRSVAMALLFPLLGPVMLGAVIVATARLVDDAREADLPLAVAGAERAPQLVQFLRQNGIAIQPAPEDPEVAVREGGRDVVLIIPETFAGELAVARPAAVKLVVDESERKSMPAVRRVTALLDAYSRQIGMLRLIARGVDPNLRDPLVVETADVSTAQSRAAVVLSMIPMFIVIAIFMGGFYIAIDSTAGERERGSLEPLVINPVARWELVAGKLGATWAFTIVSMAILVVGFSLVTRVVPPESAAALGLRHHLSPAVTFGMFLLMLPLTFFVSALQMVVASYFRTFKEAQSFVSVLLVVAMVPGIALTMLPFRDEVWMMMVPTLGEQLLAYGLLKGQGIDPTHAALSAVSTTLLGLLLAFVAARLYTSDSLTAPP